MPTNYELKILTPEQAALLYATKAELAAAGGGGGGGGGGGAVSSVSGKTGAVVLNAGDVGLGNADNTSDINKPVSTAQQTAISARVPGTRTVAGKALSADITLVKADVGLGNVDNTSDANKPISNATQTALNGKADLVGGVLSSAQLPPLAINDTFTVTSQAAMLSLTAQRGDMALRTDVTPAKWFVLSVDAPSVLSNWIEITTAGAVQSVAGKTGTVALAKADVGLSNVDNTADADKPLSTAATAALGNKASNASPAFTGTPTAPTAASTENSTILATTAFVQNLVSTSGGGGGSSGGDTRTVEMESGVYTFPATLPAGVKRINAFGAEAPTTANISGGALPTYLGTGAGKARLDYQYDSRLT